MQILLYDMGINYFTGPVESGKSPIEPRVHFTYSNKNDSTNETILSGDESGMWEAYGEVITSIAVQHFVSFGLCFNLFWFSMLWVSLTTRQLVSFYTYLLAFATVPLSYLANSQIVNNICSKDPKTVHPISLLLCEFSSLTGESSKFYFFCLLQTQKIQEHCK